MLASDLFSISPSLKPRMEKVGGIIPVIVIDDFYQRPDEIRSAALSLSYNAPEYPYPGKLAQLPAGNASVASLLHWALTTVNDVYLPNIPPIATGGKPIQAFSKVYSDFAVVDLHPDELSPIQRIPHIDPVPVFGLIYLNREERGGTMFFDQIAEVDVERVGGGYLTDSSREYRVLGRIEAAFNRLAIYPGFVPHSGEIVGEWIRTDERFTNPRLTQRLVFMP
jgi:hypothetical protein